ncbi:hypothetical protein K456DRAFT_52090 [Colletotrichum gloeosporioides 23]|nr:hypothetical protein K456DRAFT_52090 [Colletotrichum gloeosporioides 23]
MRLQTSSTANALLDVDCTKQLQKALAAVTYKGGFELVNFDDNKAPIRLCICCQAFVQHPVFETWTSGDLGGLVRTRSAKNHHETLFQLIDCCYSSRPGCRLCQVLWRSFGMSRRQPGHRYYRYEEPFKLCIMRLENSSNISLASDMVQFVDRFRPKVCPMIRVRLLRPDVVVRRGQPSYSNVGTCTNSETAFERIHEWLRTCFEKHSVCRRYPASSQTPTRRVHIDWPNRKIRLLESVGSNPQYVTLSYRWGAGRSAYKLTAETKVKLTS